MFFLYTGNFLFFVFQCFFFYLLLFFYLITSIMSQTKRAHVAGQEEVIVVIFVLFYLFLTGLLQSVVTNFIFLVRVLFFYFVFSSCFLVVYLVGCMVGYLFFVMNK